MVSRKLLAIILAIAILGSIGAIYAGVTYLSPSSIGEPQTLDYIETQTLNLTSIAGAIHNINDAEVIGTYEWTPTQSNNRLTKVTVKLEWYLGEVLDGSTLGIYGITFSLTINGKYYTLGTRATGTPTTQYKWQDITRTTTSLFITHQPQYEIHLQAAPETPHAILLIRNIQLYLNVVDG